jgi:hypothetical protein
MGGSCGSYALAARAAEVMVVKAVYLVKALRTRRDLGECETGQRLA